MSAPSHHWSFFKHSDHSFGLFYPRHYILIGLDNEGRAQEVEQIFLAAGFASDDVACASGSFVTGKLESTRDPGLIERIKIGIAHIAGTEQGYIDDDLKLARRGGAFVFVHAPDEATATRAAAIIKRIHPMYARHYRELAIDRIVYPNQSTL
ncbi:MAG TPA: hypothetical protein VGH80_03110 [Xanthomonadaceae bacterium]|jgi:hypothetical protein